MIGQGSGEFCFLSIMIQITFTPYTSNRLRSLSFLKPDVTLMKKERLLCVVSSCRVKIMRKILDSSAIL